MGAVEQNYDLGGQVIHEICRVDKPLTIRLERGGWVLSVVHTCVHPGQNSIYKTLYYNGLLKSD